MRKSTKRGKYKKPSGFAYIKLHNPERFKQICKMGDKTKGAKLGGIERNKKYPNMSKEIMINNHKKYGHIGKLNVDNLKKARENGNWKKSQLQFIKNNPNHFNKIGIISCEKQSMNKKNMNKPESIMRKLLPNDFKYGKNIGNVGVPDFVSEERKIIIECDGDYWHSKPKQIIKDKSKTAYYRKLGYTVFRIPEHDINEYFKVLT